MMVWLDWRLAIIALAPLPISLVALAYLPDGGSRAASPICGSAAPTSAAS